MKDYSHSLVIKYKIFRINMFDSKIKLEMKNKKTGVFQGLECLKIWFVSLKRINKRNMFKLQKIPNT